MAIMRHPTPSPPTADTADTLLQSLGGGLRAMAPYWRASPFMQAAPAWCAAHPELAADCLALDDASVEALRADPAALQAYVGARLPTLAALTEAVDRAAHADDGGAAVSAIPPRALAGIPGRKQQQIAHFAAQLPPGTQPLLDWCAGKAHLGRTLARLQQRPLHAVERDAALCAAGDALAAKAGVAAQYQCRDVLREPVQAPAGAQVLALHACGDLHRRLIDGPVLDAAHGLLLAPCCYHLWLDGPYRPLSAHARQADLALSRNAVQLAVQETVHAPARELRRQQELASWRLGFDSLQRELRGVDRYLPTPSLPQRVLQQGFPTFCRQLAAHKQLELPAAVDWEHYRRAGAQRLQRARRLSLVRQAFRRALELWLVQDLRLRLEERGYRTTLQAFCPREVTPRNLLIAARR